MRRLGAEIIWLIVLIIFAVIMGILLFSGNILLYLAPRMMPMVWFGFIVLSLLSIFQLYKIFRQKNMHSGNKFALSSLVFLIPVILMLTVAPNESTSGTLPNKNVQMLSITNREESVSENETISETDIAPDTSVSVSTTQEALQSPLPAEEIEQQTEAPDDETKDLEVIDTSDLPPCIFVDDTVPYDSSDDLFSSYIYNEVDDLVGQTIKLYGFVYSDDSFPQDTIMVSRLYIYCCTADASIVGFHVKVENAEDFKPDDWICVTGTVQAVPMEYFGDYYDFPILTDGTVTHCEAPATEEAYIYP